MADFSEDLGTLTRAGTRLQGRMERMLDQDPPTVWAMLTQSERLAEWLAPGTIEPRPGGAAKLNFTDSGIVIDSTVSAFDPPRLLEYSWSGPGEPERPLRWELAPQDSGTLLTLTVAIPDNEDIARTCAGWEAHLMMLAAALEGVPIKFPFERFKTTREQYKTMAASLA